VIATTIKAETLNAIPGQVRYSEFLSTKLALSERPGIDVPLRDYSLFPHQSDLTKWALRRGSAAVFADTGLGKTRIEAAWADTVHRETGLDVLMLAPLAVAEQTCEEGATIGVEINHARSDADIRRGINITNYDRLHRFDPSRFGAVVLDESSIIKHHDAKTLRALLDAFRETPYKLCATATPAPNDYMELGNHAEFLGVMQRMEMLAMFFVHDMGQTQKWRLKGHAEDEYWRWVCEWAVMLRMPSDLGYDNDGFILPELNIKKVALISGNFQTSPGNTSGSYSTFGSIKAVISTSIFIPKSAEATTLFIFTSAFLLILIPRSSNFFTT